jgi:hypothetical protein
LNSDGDPRCSKPPVSEVNWIGRAVDNRRKRCVVSARSWFMARRLIREKLGTERVDIELEPTP